MRAAFEFRHSSWFDDEIFEILRKRNCALCIADTDKLETPVIATADWGYLRLRREDYQPADVSRWGQVIVEKNTIWSDVFVYFKHEESGIGPKLAGHLLEIVADKIQPAHLLMRPDLLFLWILIRMERLRGFLKRVFYLCRICGAIHS